MWCTLPETNSKFAPKNGWQMNTIVSFWGFRPIFIAFAVSFREGVPVALLDLLEAKTLEKNTWNFKYIRLQSKSHHSQNSFNRYTPEISHSPSKMVIGRLLSYWKGNFSGAMLNLGGVVDERTSSWDTRCPKNTTEKKRWVSPGKKTLYPNMLNFKNSVNVEIYHWRDFVYSHPPPHLQDDQISVTT